MISTKEVNKKLCELCEYCQDTITNSDILKCYGCGRNFCSSCCDVDICIDCYFKAVNADFDLS